MPEAIVAWILPLPEYGVYREAFDEATQALTLWVRQTTNSDYSRIPETPSPAPSPIEGDEHNT